MLRLRIKNLDDLPLEDKVEVDINALEDEEPVPMIAAAVALYKLHGLTEDGSMAEMDDEQVKTNMRKIAYRPALRVRTFLSNLEERYERDRWQHWFTEFAKNVDYVDGVGE
jgi:hypothetical protein